MILNAKNYAVGIYLSANSFDSEDVEENVNNKNIKIVTSLEDEISDNAAKVLQGYAIEGGRGGGIFVGYDETSKNFLTRRVSNDEFT